MNELIIYIKCYEVFSTHCLNKSIILAEKKNVKTVKTQHAQYAKINQLDLHTYLKAAATTAREAAVSVGFGAPIWDGFQGLDFRVQIESGCSTKKQRVRRL